MNISELQQAGDVDVLVSSILQSGLEKNIVELAAYGFTIIPPEKMQLRDGFVDELRAAWLRVFESRTAQTVDDYRTANLSSGRGPASSEFIDLESDDVFVESVLHPIVLLMARWLCGNSAVLSIAGGIIKAALNRPPGAEDNLPLHTDAHGVPSPTSQYAHACNTSWVLTDCNDASDGPTIFVPGSHRFGHIPGMHDAQYWMTAAPNKPVPFVAKAGSLAVWHGNTWHGGSPRTNAGLRITGVLYWARPYMRLGTDWKEHTSPELLERFPELRRILGLAHPYPMELEKGPDMEHTARFTAAGLDQFA